MQSRAFLVGAAIAICGLSSANASTIFTANFNGYTGIENALQVDTGDQVAYGGSVPGWTGAGGNAVHGVELSPGNWAVMIYADNSLTLNTGVAANNAGEEYVLSFDYGAANYATEDGGTLDSDGLIVELLNADNTVFAEETYSPGAWGPGNYDLEAGLEGTLSYTGNGSGNLRIKILTSDPLDHQFGGEIDNIVLSTPEPGGFVLASGGFAALICFIARRRSSTA
jgi:hypothetical protein